MRAPGRVGHDADGAGENGVGHVDAAGAFAGDADVGGVAGREQRGRVHAEAVRLDRGDEPGDRALERTAVGGVGQRGLHHVERRRMPRGLAVAVDDQGGRARCCGCRHRRAGEHRVLRIGRVVVADRGVTGVHLGTGARLDGHVVGAGGGDIRLDEPITARAA